LQFFLKAQEDYQLIINSDKKNILWLFFFISLCLIFGNGLGGYFTFISVETWYQTLNKPSFNPPDWVFGPVWTTLYILMGISVWLVWKREPSTDRTIGIRIFWVQLFFNILWTYIFFGIQKVGLSFLEIIFLIFLIFSNVIYFLKIDKIAGYLLIPYLIWVLYASVLTYNIWILN
jgi:tryptophan-rich sensory protein